jgi:hypothetical protein
MCTASFFLLSWGLNSNSIKDITFFVHGSTGYLQYYILRLLTENELSHSIAKAGGHKEMSSILADQ